MKRIVVMIFMALSSISYAMDMSKKTEEYPSCMSITSNGNRVIYSTGRIEYNSFITITPDMIEKTIVWYAGAFRSTVSKPLSIKSAYKYVKIGLVQAVEIHFYEPSESLSRIFRASIDRSQ